MSDLIQKEYLNHNKILLTLFTLNILMLLACCIIEVLWTINALNKYSFPSELGEPNLISAITTAIVVLMSLVLWFNSRINIILRATWTIITLIFIFSLIVLITFSIFIFVFDNHCGKKSFII